MYAPRTLSCPAPTFALLLCALILTITGVSSSRAQTLELITQPSDGSFLCPEQLVVELVIDAEVLDLRGFSAVITYDPAILVPASVGGGDLIQNGAGCAHSLHWLDPGNHDGSWEVDLALLGCSVDGPGSILRLVFDGLGEGMSTIDASQSIFRDSINDDISVGSTPVQVTHACPVSNDIHTWGALKAPY